MPGPRARYHLERIRESVWDVVANGALKITYGELKKGLDENKDVSWVSPTAPDPGSQNVPPRDPVDSADRSHQPPNDAQERTGLDGAKVRRAVTLECQAAGAGRPSSISTSSTSWRARRRGPAGTTASSIRS